MWLTTSVQTAFCPEDPFCKRTLDKQKLLFLIRGAPFEQEGAAPRPTRPGADSGALFEGARGQLWSVDGDHGPARHPYSIFPGHHHHCPSAQAG